MILSICFPIVRIQYTKIGQGPTFEESSHSRGFANPYNVPANRTYNNIRYLEDVGCKNCKTMQFIMERTEICPNLIGANIKTQEPLNRTFEASTEQDTSVDRVGDISKHFNLEELTNILNQAKCIYLCGSTVMHSPNYVCQILNLVTKNNVVLNLLGGQQHFRTRQDLLERIMSKCKYIFGMPRDFDFINAILYGNTYLDGYAMALNKSRLSKNIVLMKNNGSVGIFHEKGIMFIYQKKGKNTSIITERDKYLFVGGFISSYYDKMENEHIFVDMGCKWVRDDAALQSLSIESWYYQ